ncbi:MAG: DUF1289 domain-containing protein, partial [Proteobacteria bacterium]|nr:DUF1289 domain-containing protein [Pseudomonadota bacterium]
MITTDLLAARVCQLSAGGQFFSESEAVPSPCVSVCRMSPDRSHCEGCFRTLDEIRVWSQSDGARRRAIWAAALR